MNKTMLAKLGCIIAIGAGLTTVLVQPAYSQTTSTSCGLANVHAALDVSPLDFVSLADVAFAVASNHLALSWPADQSGWTLQAQTNRLSAGLGTNWVDVPGSTTVTQVTVPLDPSNGCVFYRLARETPGLPFITRSGNRLYKGSNVFRFAGANIPWLGLISSRTYPSPFRILDALLTAREMGATVVRSHTLGISVGNPNSIEPALNQFNDNAFQPIDYSIAAARTNGIYLIIPLTDNWHYYEGGKHTFTEWRNLTNEDLFYSNPAVINDFKNYIGHILNHTNPYTGVPLKDEPAILAWETGNELNNATSAWDNNWTEMMAAYIKSIDPRHLVADGHTSEGNASGMLSTNQLALPDVDLYTSHFYPPIIAQLQTNAVLAGQYDKVFYVGEYDWSDQDAALARGTIAQDGSVREAGNYSARVDVTQNSSKNYWYIQLLSGTFTLNANSTYTVNFWAQSSSNNLLEVAVQQAAFPYTTLVKTNYRLNAVWGHYSLTLSTQQSWSAFLAFNFAATLGSIWVDNVSVSNGLNNLVNNPSFENTGSGWLAPWHFKVTVMGDAFTNFIPAVEETNSYFVSGDLFWQLFGHDDNYGYDHGDPYTLHYPGDTADMQWRAQTLRTHAYSMTGVPVPAHMIPPAPQLNSITPVAAGNSVVWRGSAAAGSYTLKRSTDAVHWTTVASNLTDLQAPWTDTNADPLQLYYYQMIPFSLDGVAGAPSNIKASGP